MAKTKRTITYRGQQLKVLLTLKIAGRKYSVVNQSKRRGRVRYRAFSRMGRELSQYSIHKMPNTHENRKRIENVRRAEGTSLPLARVSAIQESGSTLLVVAEWLHGQSLKSYLQEVRDSKRPALSVLQASRLNAEFVNQVFALSKLGIFHGDISPDNLIVTTDNHLRLIDFGSSFRFSEMLALKTGDGLKPIYSAPEIVSGGVPSTSSEQFSCGVVFFEMLTGSIPYFEMGGTAPMVWPENEIGCFEPISKILREYVSAPATTMNLIEKYFERVLSITPNGRFCTNRNWINAAFEIRDSANYVLPDSPPDIFLVKVASRIQRFFGSR